MWIFPLLTEISLAKSPMTWVLLNPMTNSQVSSTSGVIVHRSLLLWKVVFTWLLTLCSSSGTPGLSPASWDPLLVPPLHLNLLVLMYLMGSVPGSPPSFVNTHSLSDNIHSHSLNTTNILIIPKFLSVCLTFPLNSRITYPNAFLSLQLGCLTSHINTSKSEILIFSSQNALLTVSHFPVDSYSILPGSQANIPGSSFDVSLSLISYYNL